MRRAFVLLLVLLAALVAAGPTAGAETPERGMYFQLHAGGFLVQVDSNLGSGRVRLTLDRRGEVAYYYVSARVGAGTVRARFGRLGRLDLRFRPSRGEGALGCDGEEEGWQRGTFRGAFVFHGEHHYAHIDADRARGWFQTYGVGGCAGNRPGSGAAAAASRAHEVAETGVNLEGFTSETLPTSYFYFFTEDRKAGVRTSFNAFRDERREGMLIERGAQVYGGAAGFAWDLGAGTAKVEPPAPFIGRAFFRRGTDGRSTWKGSLSVPILGGTPMRLTGSVFDPHLGPSA